MENKYTNDPRKKVTQVHGTLVNIHGYASIHPVDVPTFEEISQNIWCAYVLYYFVTISKN